MGSAPPVHIPALSRNSRPPESRVHYRDDKDFDPTIDAAAEELGISPTAVEKDYWVAEVLRALYGAHPSDFIFKGGTSLSKAYQLIERFSEDIDLLVIAGDRGRGATDTLMKRMAAAAAAGVDGDLEQSGDSRSGVHRAYDVLYPTTRPATEVVRTRVLLEMGVRGDDFPTDSVAIGCLLGDALLTAGVDIEQYRDLAPFEAVVLHPGRTLLEKMFAVHDISTKIEQEPDYVLRGHAGRHFYDIYQLLGDAQAMAVVGDVALREDILESIERVNEEYFRGAARPAEGFATSPAFTQGTTAYELLRQEYVVTMPELYYGSKPLPEWVEIQRRVQDSGL